MMTLTYKGRGWIDWVLRRILQELIKSYSLCAPSSCTSSLSLVFSLSFFFFFSFLFLFFFFFLHTHLLVIPPFLFLCLLAPAVVGLYIVQLLYKFLVHRLQTDMSVCQTLCFPRQSSPAKAPQTKKNTTNKNITPTPNTTHPPPKRMQHTGAVSPFLLSHLSFFFVPGAGEEEGGRKGTRPSTHSLIHLYLCLLYIHPLPLHLSWSVLLSKDPSFLFPFIPFVNVVCRHCIPFYFASNPPARARQPQLLDRLPWSFTPLLLYVYHIIMFTYHLSSFIRASITTLLVFFCLLFVVLWGLNHPCLCLFI